MDMQVNYNLIKEQRQNRAWSQSHLENVSGLSLRTIQRIEKTGTASLESVKSIASVFEMKIVDFQPPVNKALPSIKAKVAALLAATSMILAAFIVIPASAQPVMIDFIFAENSTELSNVKILSEDQTESEIIIANQLKIVLTSKVASKDTVDIAINLYDLSSGKEVLIHSPKFTTKHLQTAEIRFDDYALFLTPEISTP
ncbi:helix-turn-helix domain-containing protein [Shewanella abyssi]|uniref:helix-turn-helix transcriptional regulator n=1 Tax=Shewanella abyssi TaxID=311789 RepID=UPI00200DA4CE|nr:helix-turn-helix transcriptional regulator [Shewanella abyssi]MCL1048537.1 helix-turn-helix domain-containing protein [Shewanella abyssi]